MVSSRLKIEVQHVELASVKLLPEPENARYMDAAEYQQLVANLKRDGVLTSTPLLSKEHICLSGNHRLQAAMEAGIDGAPCLVILNKLNPQERRAIQLSHNQIVGKDDPAILARLYRELPLILKRYSGLTDDVLNIPQPDLTTLTGGAPRYQTATFLLLPLDADVVRVALDKLQENGRVLKPQHAAALEDFDRLFNAVVTVKEQRRVYNSGLALRVLCDLAMERLAELQGEDAREA